MARTVLTVALVILLGVLAGCTSIDSGRAQLVAAGAKQSTETAAIKVAGAGETDVVEQVAVNRQAYRQGLELLREHYIKTGNNMKLLWAKKELAALDAMPQYNYIIKAGVAGPNLKASSPIAKADDLYQEGLELERNAGPLPLLKNEESLRLALDKFNQLIRKHPSSDKIDDAAYRAGIIYEYFKDYTIALLYYQRAYQWKPDTVYPARFKAAFVLDKRLHRRDEALVLYQEAVKAIKKEGEHQQWKKFAEKRIRKFSESGE